MKWSMLGWEGHGASKEKALCWDPTAFWTVSSLGLGTGRRKQLLGIPWWLPHPHQGGGREMASLSSRSPDLDSLSVSFSSPFLVPYSV